MGQLFGSPSVTIWPCHCLPGYPCQGPLAHSTCVTPWAHLCLTRVAPFLDHLHLSPDGDDGMHNRALHLCLLSIFLPLHSPLVVAQIPQPTDGALLQNTPGDSPDGAMLRVQKSLSKHLQLPVDCRFCHAAVGDLVHCLSECPWFEDLRTE